MNDFQKKYLDETGHRLRRKGFTVLPKNEGVLQVEMAGVLLCHRINCKLTLNNRRQFLFIYCWLPGSFP